MKSDLLVATSRGAIMVRTLVISVDRDNDLGMKTAIRGPVIGRKNVQHLQVMRQRDQNAGCERCHNENVLLVHPLR